MDLCPHFSQHCVVTGGTSSKVSHLSQVLFEEAFIKQVRVAGPPFVLQAEEQVPEVDSGDSLSCKLSGACSAGCSRLGGA